MDFAEYAGEQELKEALITRFSNACEVIVHSRHRILIQIATNQGYPIKLVTAIFREYGRHTKRNVLFGIITGAEPLTNEEGVRAAALDFGLQLRNRLPFLKFEYVPYWDSHKILGTTQDFVILDLTTQFNPDDVATVVESVTGPGLVILFTPPLEEWQSRVTRFVDQLNIYGDPLPPSRFLAHFLETVKNGANIIVVEEEQNRLGWAPCVQSDPGNVVKMLIPETGANTIAALALTTDQRDILTRLKIWLKDAIGRNRTSSHCYLNAARGRGKTATLGLVTGDLFAEQFGSEKGAKKITLVITSPDLMQVQPAFQALQNALMSTNVKFQLKNTGDLLSEVSCSGGTLFYVPPGDVTSLKRIDAVIIDEAGSIPLPLLEKVANMGFPCVWSTTTYGYEGVGRGFALKFLPWLVEKWPEVEEFTMTTPIRYAPGDPVEKLLFDAFFLDSDLPEIPPQINTPGKFTLLRQPNVTSIAEDRLRAIFGLLIQAHYKTRPSDFVPILDVPSWQLWVYQTEQTNPVGAILATPEGGLSPDSANQLANARKERQGLLVSWVIALHHQAPNFVQDFRGLRINRIAIHPLLQKKGLGTEMLAQLELAQKEAGLAFLATSFGTTPALIHFWLKAGYIPIHIGLKRSPETGEYSVVMMKSLNVAAQADIAMFGADFKVKLIDWARDVLFDAAPSTIAPLLLYQNNDFENKLPRITFTASETRRLNAYSQDVLKYKAATDVIRKLFLRYVYDMHPVRPKLDGKTLEIIIAKLQSRSWKTIQALVHVPAQRAYGMLREAIKQLVKHYQIS